MTQHNAPIDAPGPFRMPTRQMPADWVDYNGHITESRYLSLCGIATDALLTYVGIDAAYRSDCGSYFTVETHLRHLGELHAGDQVQVHTQVLGVDDKRLHLFHVISREGDEGPVATGEQMLLHVMAGSGRSGPVQGPVAERLLQLAKEHAELPRPARAGASIGMARQR